MENTGTKRQHFISDEDRRKIVDSLIAFVLKENKTTSETEILLEVVKLIRELDYQWKSSSV